MHVGLRMPLKRAAEQRQTKANKRSRLRKDDHVRKDKPAYVVNIPVAIDSDPEADSSDVENSDVENNDYSFPKEYFKSPFKYFRLQIKEGIRGKIAKEQFIPNEQGNRLSNHPASELLKKLETESFGHDEEESISQSSQRLGVVIGLNRMRSLSGTQNRRLIRTAESLPISSLSVKQVGFFWEGHWQEKREQEWVQTSFDRVQKFYHQLKKKQPNLAKRFRKGIEQRKYKQIPYRELREYVKNYDGTRELVRAFRQEDKEVYLSIFDKDVIALRAEKKGVFSHYDKMIACNLKKYGEPLEMNRPFLQCRSIADMQAPC